jgi:hypothetical protein
MLNRLNDSSFMSRDWLLQKYGFVGSDDDSRTPSLQSDPMSKPLEPHPVITLTLKQANEKELRNRQMVKIDSVNKAFQQIEKLLTFLSTKSSSSKNEKKVLSFIIDRLKTLRRIYQIGEFKIKRDWNDYQLKNYDGGLELSFKIDHIGDCKLEIIFDQGFNTLECKFGSQHKTFYCAS